MKKWVAVLMICAMMSALCACGKKEASDLQEKASEPEIAEVTEISNDMKNDNNTETDLEEQPAIENEPSFEAQIEPTAEPKKVNTKEEIYAQVLDGYYADLVSEFPIDNYFPMTLGTFEITIGCPIENILNSVGYVLKDINGDGTEELLIMAIYDDGETSYQGERILAMYTIVNDEARFIAGGWARNRFYLLKDGRIYNEGSSGADDSSFETYRLIENSGILEQIDAADSRSDDFEQQYKELEKLIETVEIESFAEYETSDKYPESAKTFWSAVYVDPAEKTFATVGSDSFTADDSEYARDLVFFTPSEVSDFKFNALKAVDVNDGEVTFEEEELYALDSLVMDNAITITMTFVGDTPGYGIAYTDAEGNIRRYAVCESGYDGSIYLSRY